MGLRWEKRKDELNNSLSLFFYLEDEGSRFFQNLRNIPLDYKASGSIVIIMKISNLTKLKLSFCLIKHLTINMYVGVEVWLSAFLILALAVGKWSSSLHIIIYPKYFTCQSAVSLKNISMQEGENMFSSRNREWKWTKKCENLGSCNWQTM